MLEVNIGKPGNYPWTRLIVIRVLNSHVAIQSNSPENSVWIIGSTAKKSGCNLKDTNTFIAVTQTFFHECVQVIIICTTEKDV